MNRVIMYFTFTMPPAAVSTNLPTNLSDKIKIFCQLENKYHNLMLLDARYLHLLHGARLAGDDAAPLEAAVARSLHLDDGPLWDEPAPPAHPGAGARVASPLPTGRFGQAGAVGHGVAVVGRVLQEGQLALLQRLLLLPTLPTVDRSPPQPVVSFPRRPQHAIRPA